MQRIASIAVLACGCWTGSEHPAPPARAPEPAPTATARPVVELAPGTVSTLSPDDVVTQIHASYLAGVRRCYVRELKKSASARGRVTLAFTIDPEGHVRNATARGVSGEVEACIAAQFTSWRFPGPRDATGAPTEASFALALDLVPD